MKVKRHIQAFLAFGFSALILLSAGGFSMDLHFCQGHLKSVALFGKARSCHEATSSQVCRHHSGEKEEVGKKDPKKCCENRTTIIKSDIDLFYSPMVLEVSTVQPLANTCFSFEIPVVNIKEQGADIRDRAPPDQYREPLYIVNESFLL